MTTWSMAPAQTILVGEIRHWPGAGWAVGTTATLRNTGTPVGWQDPLRLNPVASARPRVVTIALTRQPSRRWSRTVSSRPPTSAAFESLHPGGANFLFGDGSVRLLTPKIKPEIYRSLGHRADGNLISDDEF